MYKFAIEYLEDDVIKVVDGENVSIEDFQIEYGKLNDIVFVTLVKVEGGKIK